VSGTDPSTSHDKLYSNSDINCFGFDEILTDTGCTEILDNAKLLFFYLNLIKSKLLILTFLCYEISAGH